MSEVLNDVNISNNPTSAGSEGALPSSLQDVEKHFEQIFLARNELQQTYSLTQDNDYNTPPQVMSTQQLKKSEEKQTAACGVCSKKFNPLTNRKMQCNYCGTLLCKQHCTKSRADSQMAEQSKQQLDCLRSICDSCDEKFLKAEVTSRFNEQMKYKLDLTEQLHVEILEKVGLIDTTKLEMRKIQAQQNESTRRFEESKKNVEDEVAQSGSELENQQKESSVLIENIDSADKQIALIQAQIKQAEQQLAQEEKQGKDTAEKIRDTDQDIANMQTAIEKKEAEESNQKQQSNQKQLSQPLETDELQSNKNNNFSTNSNNNNDSSISTPFSPAPIKKHNTQPVPRESNCNMCFIF